MLYEVITMLEQKTAGNRTPEEDALIGGLLYQTRMAYLDAVK